ncbi:hypothetical protein Cha6605_4343 [Chamaesiphon minutus PCC 6605]|uniref:Uncharacterized protein n=1 Tax=Chamaesiphon minutus (strain ATCC 27169 / PCC 6605) TaxID=1173020 RepID=K9UM81_CHAP6|nr:hypothetical protein Cha6605_4343 [Chamaesiphon minutus PCC 6605]
MLNIYFSTVEIFLISYHTILKISNHVIFITLIYQFNDLKKLEISALKTIASFVTSSVFLDIQAKLEI